MNTWSLVLTISVNMMTHSTYATETECREAQSTYIKAFSTAGSRASAECRRFAETFSNRGNIVIVRETIR